MAEKANPFAQLFKTQPSSNLPGIQLAILHAGQYEDKINVSLTTTLDLTATKYDCVSYDRSQKYSNVDITVDGHDMAIQEPLESALRALRRTDVSRLLWADLLIGRSAAERNQQALATKKIVENAASTIVWLGTSNGSHTKEAFDILQTMANRYRQACLHSGFPHILSRATATQMMGLQDHLLSRPLDELQPNNMAAWKTVEEILTTSYFKSLQAIAEIILAKHVFIISGTSKLDWEDYIYACRGSLFIMAQQMHRNISEAQKRSFELISSIEVAERRRRQGEPIELLPMIQSSRDRESSDPREFVFAMLPIVDPSGRTKNPGGKKETLPEIDYEKTTAQVFIEAARYIIHERQDLLLWWCERPPRGRKVHGLPSWVPDWTSPQPSGSVKVLPDSSNGMRVWWEYIDPSAKRITVDADNALHVQAHGLDRILSVSPIFTLENCRRLCLTEWQALPMTPNETHDAKIQKVFRTLVFNQAAGIGESMRQTPPPPRDMWISFQSVLSEERILELLGCTMEEMMTNPELVARAKADPQMSILGPQTGKSEPFEQLLRRNAIGRRFFVTENGRTGMTAIESPPTNAGAEDARPLPSFDEALREPLGRMLLDNFQSYIAERDPAAARALAKGLQGDLQGQAPPGARSGDLIVALVGGYQPYILRPADSQRTSAEETAQQTLVANSRYHYVGDCYLHGAMNGELLKTRGWFGTQNWNGKVDLIDISLV